MSAAAAASATPLSDEYGWDGSSVSRLGADWESVLEAIRSPAIDDDSWAEAISYAIEEALATPVRVRLQVIEQAAGLERTRANLRIRTRGPRDVEISVVAYPLPGTVVVARATFARPVTLSHHDRRVLSRIALQLEAGYLLRHEPESVVARVWDDGRVSPSQDAGKLWSTILSGAYCLVERWQHNDRSYLVLENASEARHRRALSRTELDVVSMAMRGMTTKVIAFDLGMTPSGVSNRLAQAARKIGVSTRCDLLRIARALATTEDAPLVDAALTDAERDVLSMVRSGMSNGEIATARSRSVRTIANQVSSVLRKTRAASRRALLVARCDAHAPSR